MSDGSSLQAILDRLSSVRRIGDQYQAACPAHESAKRQSLSVTVKDRKILLHCFAGCTTQQIVQALNLTMDDLFLDDHEPEPATTSPGKKPDFAKTFEDWSRNKIPASAYEYLKERGLDRSISKPQGKMAYAPSTGEYKASLVFALTPWNKSRIQGLQYLPIGGGEKKFARGTPAKSVFFRLEGEGPPVVVEGIIDGLSVLEAIPGVHVASILSASSVQKLKTIPQEPILFFDNDPAGRVATRKAVELLEGKCRVVDWSISPNGLKDANDLLKAGHVDAIRRMVDTARSPAAPARTFPCTDLGNAERFAAQHRENVRFCHTWGKWLTWTGQRWKVDDTGRITQLAKDTVRSIYAEAANAIDDDHRKALAKHARSSEASGKIQAMLQLAQSEPGIPIRPNDLDRSPWLLNITNGTLELKTGTLRPHRREDLITKMAPVTFDPNAQCPTWLRFLERIMDRDESLVSYLQKAIGYTLTGDTREKALIILHGGGDNGKTVFTATLGGMLGDYAQETPVETLMVRRNECIPNDIARLKGSRLVTASEGERGQRLAESLIKRLTGGDRITARFMHAEFFEYTPEFKIWLSTNHKPVIWGTDTAIWSRIHLVPFKVAIPKAEQIPRTVLLDKLKQEWPGILAWAVQGCLSWQREGLVQPKEIERATSNYRAESDVLAEFITDCCVIRADAKVKTSSIYQAYTEWCKYSNEKPIHKRTLVNILQERGFRPKRLGEKSERGWEGIGLRSKETIGEQTTDTDTDTDTDRRTFSYYLREKKQAIKIVESPSACVGCVGIVTCFECLDFQPNLKNPNFPGRCMNFAPHDGEQTQAPRIEHRCREFTPKGVERALQ